MVYEGQGSAQGDTRVTKQGGRIEQREKVTHHVALMEAATNCRAPWSWNCRAVPGWAGNLFYSHLVSWRFKRCKILV